MEKKNNKTDLLLYGNILYFSDSEILSLQEKGHIAAIGDDCTAGSSGRIRFYTQNSTDRTFPRLFQAYDFSTAIFVSGYLTWQSEPENEIEEVRSFLHQCQKHGVKRAVYLTSQDLCEDSNTSRHMELEFIENLCRHYAHDTLQIQIVHSPYFISGSVRKDSFHKMFFSMEQGNGWHFPVSPEEVTDFIAMDDLVDFLQRLLDKPAEADLEIFDLRGYTRHTFQDVADLLSAEYPGQSVSCSQEKAAAVRTLRPDSARERFGWFARFDVFDDFDRIQEEYRAHPEKKVSRRKRILHRLTEGRTIRIVELLGGAFLMELLNHILGNSVQFRMIDVRLLYVVLLSSVYGMRIGFLAAVLAMASLVRAFLSIGIDGWMLFYAPENWLPFILFLLAAAVCGFIHERRSDEKQDLENRLAEDEKENTYTNQLYEEAIGYKQEYKQNLIQSQDSFGRIFSIVQKLSDTEPSKIYENAVGVMEDILKTDSIAIYSMGEKQTGFARLEVSSAGITGSLRRSIRLSDYPEIISLLEKNQIWVNRELKSTLPMYVFGISAEKHLRVIIALYKVAFDQMNTYHMNLIRVLRGLMEGSLLQAWNYQRAVEEKTHIEGTILITDEAFQRELATRRDMADRNLLSYCLFRIRGNGRTAKEMDHILSGKLRESDLVTFHRADGNYYILALQSDQKSEALLLNRFRSLGLDCETVEIQGTSA